MITIPCSAISIAVAIKVAAAGGVTVDGDASALAISSTAAARGAPLAPLGKGGRSSAGRRSWLTTTEVNRTGFGAGQDGVGIGVEDLGVAGIKGELSGARS